MRIFLVPVEFKKRMFNDDQETWPCKMRNQLLAGASNLGFSERSSRSLICVQHKIRRSLRGNARARAAQFRDAIHCPTLVNTRTR
jgi:hypothetical protein